MNYRITEEMSKKAVEIISNDEINERLIVLKNQLDFLGGSYETKGESDSVEVSLAKENLKKLQDLLSTLDFKKQNLETLLDEKLSSLDIPNSVKIKSELNQLQDDINCCTLKQKELNSVISNDKLDYNNQMLKIKEKYDDLDILKQGIENSEFSENVINDYKKERASKLVVQFLDSLSEDKREQVLNENENLKGYLNVGENI